MAACFFEPARRCVRGAGFALALGAAAAAQDRDRHVGYYYPPATVTESFQAGATTVTGASRVRRIGLIAAITQR